MIQLSYSATQILNQLEQLVLQLEPAQFTHSAEVLNGASTGQHVRHIIEFFTCLLQGSKSGKVNYDLRAHDKLIETDPDLAISHIRMLQNFMSEVPPAGKLILETAYHHQDNVWLPVETTFDRELAYCIDHAIHHMAMIKMGLPSVAPEVVTDPGFGTAFSTQRHHKQTQDIAEE